MVCAIVRRVSALITLIVPKPCRTQNAFFRYHSAHSTTYQTFKQAFLNRRF
eukprot:COSAG06_NODE_288_length_18224_cov_8.849948_31_plen_51_part_00